MSDSPTDDLLARWTGEDRALPRWLAALLDETFLWVAAGQLLLALGVPAPSVRRLSEVQAVLEEIRATLAPSGLEIPRLEGVLTYGDLDRLGRRLDALAALTAPTVPDRVLERTVPAPLLVSWSRRVGAVLLDLAEEVLGRLHERRIRTELIGLDHGAALRLLAETREMLRDPSLDRAAEDGHEGLRRWLEALETDRPRFGDGLEVRPVAPQLGEVGRIVSVVHDIPRETLDRLLPVRVLGSRPVLAALIARGLRQHRDGWVPVQERVTPELAAREAEAARRAQEEREAERLRGYFAGVDSRDAEPRRSAALRSHAALLCLLCALFVGWQVLVMAVGVLGVGLELPERPMTADMEPIRAQLHRFWPLVAAAAPTGAAVVLLAARVHAIDRIELMEDWKHLRADVTAPRRGRRRAAGGAAAISGASAVASCALALFVLTDRGSALLPLGEPVDEPAVAIVLLVPVLMVALGLCLGAGTGGTGSAEQLARRTGFR